MAAQYTHASLFTSNHLKKQRGTLLCHLKMFLETKKKVATRLQYVEVLGEGYQPFAYLKALKQNIDKKYLTDSELKQLNLLRSSNLQSLIF